MNECWRKANPGLSWGKPCPQCGTYVRIYGDGSAEKQNLSGWLRNCPTPREQLNSMRACFGKPPINKAVPPACEPTAAKTAGAAAGCRISRAPNNDCGSRDEPAVSRDIRGSVNLPLTDAQSPALGVSAGNSVRNRHEGNQSLPQSPNVSSGVDGDTHSRRQPTEEVKGRPVLSRAGRPEDTSRFDSGLLTPIPPPSAAPEAVTPRAWAVSDTDDFGLLRSLPLVIPASLILWAVIAAAWIALK